MKRLRSLGAAVGIMTALLMSSAQLAEARNCLDCYGGEKACPTQFCPS